LHAINSIIKPNKSTFIANKSQALPDMGVGGTNNSAVHVALPQGFSAFNVYRPASS
jgi:hypothetical protein